MAAERYQRRKAAEADAEEVLVDTETGVTVSPEEAERNEADQAAVESQETPVDEPEQEYKSVTYVGEQETLPSQYGTFVKGQPVSLPADVADSLSESTDGNGEKVFEVK